MRGSLIVAVMLAALSVASAGTVYQVTVDTSSITPGTNGFLGFQFNAVDTDSLLGLVSIYNFSPNASLTEPGTSTGDVDGTLSPGPLRIWNSAAWNSYLVPFLFDGTQIAFLLVFSGDAVDHPGGTENGSTFGFSLLAADYSPLATNDEFGNAFLIDVNPDGTTTPTLYAGGPGGEPPVTTLEAVPEPATGLLLAGALAALLRFRRRKSEPEREPGQGSWLR